MNKLIPWIFFLFSSFCLLSQTNSIHFSPPLITASPSIAGMSQQRLDNIDQLCKDYITSGKLPAMAALIVRNGKIVFHEAYGFADLPSGKKLDKNDIFRIASQTKAITSTAVMMLWEEGKFRLDDPISRYIPEFENAGVLDTLYADGTYETIPAEKPITIRHLLTHTSGIGYGVIDGDPRMKKIYADAGIVDLFTTEPVTIKDNIQKLAKLPLHHHPGEKFTYSEGLDVLGYFIEVISGMSFSDFLQTRLFEPLGMHDTGFYHAQEKADRLVSIHEKKDGNWQKFPITFYDPDYPVKGAKTFYSGGAGLSSTLKDYAVFLQMYLNNGEYNGVRILSRTTIETMMQNQVGDLWGNNGKHYGLAFGVVDDKGVTAGGLGMLGTFDWGGYFNTQYFADPQEKVIGLVFKQTRGRVDDQSGWQFRQMVFAAIDD